MLSVLEIIKRTTEFFANKGIESPRLNAELLVGHSLGLKRMQLYVQFERLLTEPELEKIRPLVRRRGLREPVQYILGETDFFGVHLKVDKRALIPRPETELLVENVVGRLAVPPARILDLGTGSGAIALALAKHFPSATIVAVDTSPEALALAQENAVATGFAERVSFLPSSWFEQIPAEPLFDLIVSNPPYLSAGETAAAAPEVRAFEPLSALTSAGADGLADLSLIVAGAAGRLVPGGLLALETGIGHHAELVRLVKEAGYSEVESLQDLTKRDRFVLAKR